jgi:hypothetical protein
MDGYVLFYKDFIDALRTVHAATDAIFSYELNNELYYENDQPPLSLATGTVKAVNGKTYNMGVPADKDKMIAETMPYWINGVRGAILSEDPTALVSVGFFAPQKPQPGDVDQRLAVSTPVWASMADFVDLHLYKLPADPADPAHVMQAVVGSFGATGVVDRPVIMGEYGAQHLIPSTAEAAFRLTAWQVESCGFGFDGWLLWTWDLTPADDPTNVFYSAVDGNGEINSALSPNGRPNPCSWQ